jgi:hypothetical protein
MSSQKVEVRVRVLTKLPEETALDGGHKRNAQGSAMVSRDPGFFVGSEVAGKPIEA